MKNLICILVIFLSGIVAYSQEEDIYNLPPEPEFIPKVNFGTSMGVNNFNGILGFNTEFLIKKNITFKGGLGIGYWGYKIALGAQYYRYYPKGAYFGLSFTGTTGIDSIMTDVKTEPFDEEREVQIDYKPAFNMNLTIGYQFRLSKRCRILLDLGYSVPLNRNVYKIVTPGITLAEESKANLDLLTPGGVVFGLGFSIGI